MHRKQAIDRAERLARQFSETILVVPCGAGRYVTKTILAATKGGYIGEAIYAALAKAEGC